MRRWIIRVAGVAAALLCLASILVWADALRAPRAWQQYLGVQPRVDADVWSNAEWEARMHYRAFETNRAQFVFRRFSAALVPT